MILIAIESARCHLHLHSWIPYGFLWIYLLSLLTAKRIILIINTVVSWRQRAVDQRSEIGSLPPAIFCILKPTYRLHNITKSPNSSWNISIKCASNLWKEIPAITFKSLFFKYYPQLNFLKLHSVPGWGRQITKPLEAYDFQKHSGILWGLDQFAGS